MFSAECINYLSKILKTHQKLRFSEWITIVPKDELSQITIKIDPIKETASFYIDNKTVIETVKLSEFDQKLNEYGY